jgi:hypothetical protein
LLSGSHDDPIFVGIQKVFGRIVSNQCNNKNNLRNPITYHCNVMNIFSCPFESVESYKNIDEKDETSKLPYKREDLFALNHISFAIEQTLSTFFEITKNNEIIYEVDFVNDRVQEIHTKYNGEPESWGWHESVIEQLSKVKPISKIVIRDEQDVYNILTNKEKLEILIEEYEKKNSHRLANEERQQVCCDENTPCVPDDENNSNEKDLMIVDATNNNTKSHKGENRHCNKLKEESDNEKLISNLKGKIKDKLEEHEKEQQIMLKENKQNIINFIIDNKDSIRIKDLKIYEPVYKCYKEKGNCQICNTVTNIICTNCCNSHHNNNAEIWLCSNHWKEYVITYY